MKLIELKDIIETDSMLGLPEFGINVYLTDETFKRHECREVKEIYIDRSDCDLVVELKELTLKEHDMLATSLPKKVYAVDLMSKWKLDDAVISLYGDRKIEEVYVQQDESGDKYLVINIHVG